MFANLRPVRFPFRHGFSAAEAEFGQRGNKTMAATRATTDVAMIV